MANIAVGIDIGNTNSKAAVFKNGKIQLVPNSIGDTLTPSIVAILDEGEAIGEETMMYKTDEKHTITEIKRLLGKNISDLKDLKRLNYDLFGDMDKLQIRVNRKGKEEYFSPEQILSLLFRKLMKDASDFMETGTMLTKAVITVPGYFDPKQRSVAEESAKLAGIDVIGVISEPTAAALAYGLGTKEDLSNSLALLMTKEDNVTSRKVLVFDLGGGSFDISIFIIDKTEFKVKATLGDTNFGGIDFDYRLIDYCIRYFCQKMNLNENDIRKNVNSIRRLKLQCIKAKKQLSKNESSLINIYNFFNGLDLYLEITRKKFNEECDELFKKIEGTLDKVIKDSQFSNDLIDDVILVGGASKMTKIKEIFLERFNASKIRDQINQDEAVVIGATWKAHKMLKNSKDIKILEILPAPLGVGVVSKIDQEKEIGLIMSVLIDKNERLPAKSKAKEYKTIKDDQSYFKIKVFSGEDKFTKNNRFLGEIKMDNLPKGKAGSVFLSINFEVDQNGILVVKAEVQSTEIKVTKVYSIYNNDDKGDGQVKTSALAKNPTIIRLKKNEDSRKLLDSIKDLTKIIDNKNDEFINQNNNDKNAILEDLCKYCSQIINIYEKLRKDNDNSESLYEKLFYYTKLLLHYYSQKIIINEDNNIIKDVVEKIETELSKYINDNIENLLETFEQIKNAKPKIYCEIILFIVEKLYKEGDKYLEEMKSYARYNSKKLYQKAEKIKKYLDDNLKKEMNSKLITKFDEITNMYGKKVDEIDSFAFLIKNQVDEKNTEFIPGKTGATRINNKIKQILKNENILNLLDITNPENVYLMLDAFEGMIQSLSKKDPSDEEAKAEAFCIANIIKINFAFFKNYDFKFYDRLFRRIEKLFSNIDEDEDDFVWYNQLLEIKEKIKEKEEEEENKKREIEKKNKKAIDDINIYYKNIKKEDKPHEFLDFLIDKYPFSKYNSSQSEALKQKGFEELFKEIFPLYHPDNYKDRDDYNVYHEIYILLVDMENTFIKKQ